MIREPIMGNYPGISYNCLPRTVRKIPAGQFKITAQNVHGCATMIWIQYRLYH